MLMCDYHMSVCIWHTYFLTKPGPIVLLKQKIMLNKFRLSRSEQDTSHGSLAGNVILVSIIQITPVIPTICLTMNFIVYCFLKSAPGEKLTPKSALT